MCNSTNYTKKENSSTKQNGTNSKFIKLKEQTKKDIEKIDKEISETLLVINNKIAYKNSKKQNTKSSSCNEKDLMEMKNVKNKVFYSRK